MRSIFAFAFLIIPYFALCQNPLLPPGIYMADPAAQVWDDGRLYLYCSVDETGNWYCSKKYHVLSTNDMVNWRLHENTFSTIGEDDQVPYNDNLLFAPDCMYRNGKYFLYYCQPDQDHAEGIAVSEKPYGPFKDGKPMDVGRYNEIDPGVFIDDDGQAYYIWGQFSLKMAKLKTSMTEIEQASIAYNVLTEEEHYFHEGAYLTKRDGLYYLVYADMSRGNTPTCIGYATSDKPMGPYEYGGVIIDNDHSDPQCWNNHGSIAAYKGQWYVFYHRSTHGTRMMRKACIEPITFNADGSIPEVEMTSQGAGRPLDAYSEIDAARACWMFGNVRIEAIGEHNEALVKAKHNDRSVIKYVDFGEKGAKEAEILLQPGTEAGSVHLKLDHPWKESIAVFNTAEAEEDADWIRLTGNVKNATGIHALWIIFYGDRESGDFGCSVDALEFRN
ncbi:MAG: family 43 glycosylhydrolase [Bacteroidales bacterium]|nr:family 43 glycosylhydrolase [Bacteroidales bacterium]